MNPIVRLALFVSLYLLSVAYALARGGRPERQMATIMGFGVIATCVVLSPAAVRFHGPEYGAVLVDTAILIGYIWLALTADRYWIMWEAAMQTVIVLTHLAMIFRPVAMPAYYANTVQLWSYPEFLLLAVGTLRHRLRGQPNGIERLIEAAAHRLAVLVGHERHIPVPRRATAADEQSQGDAAG